MILHTHTHTQVFAQSISTRLVLLIPAWIVPSIGSERNSALVAGVEGDWGGTTGKQPLSRTKCYPPLECYTYECLQRFPKNNSTAAFNRKGIYWLLSGCRLTAAAKAKTVEKKTRLDETEQQRGFFFNPSNQELLNAILKENSRNKEILQVESVQFWFLYDASLLQGGWLSTGWCPGQQDVWTSDLLETLCTFGIQWCCQKLLFPRRKKKVKCEIIWHKCHETSLFPSI